MLSQLLLKTGLLRKRLGLRGIPEWDGFPFTSAALTKPVYTKLRGGEERWEDLPERLSVGWKMEEAPRKARVIRWSTGGISRARPVPHIRPTPGRMRATSEALRIE
jgi:hypothetical protein